MNVYRKPIAAVALAAAFLTFAGGSFAQTDSKAGVVAGCSSGGDCAALVRSYVEALRKSGANAPTVDAELTDLAVQLGTVAQGSILPTVRGQIALGISAAAGSVSDAALRRQIQQVASSVSAGEDIPDVASSGA